ncbi:MAG: GNAT family N-acetyltransferase, partial [Oscillospiraceae bacterium]|nr:GNAT family N-acetyltransferase [Oscillospiraceae bacterium]
MMPDEIYTLFREVLPEVVRSEETVREILGNPGNRVFAHREDGTLAGVSVVGGNTIFLLCVGEPYRNRGIGSALLIESERFIKANGYDSVVIGAGSDYITPGVPMNRGAHLFFQKRGYRHSWGESGCFDMEAD